MSSERIFTNLTSDQFLSLTKIGIQDDRSMSWLVARAVSLYISKVRPFEGEANIKVMSRVPASSAKAVRDLPPGKQWRYVNAAVQELINARFA